MVKLEVGKCYKTVDGRKIGPLLNDNWNGGTFITRCEFAGGLWKENGEAVIRGAVDSPTLVSEWVEEFKLEVGKFYKTRDGRKIGPIVVGQVAVGYSILIPWPFKTIDSLFWYKENGFSCPGVADLHDDKDDLIEEWKEEEMKFEVGDLVTKEGWEEFFEVVEVGNETLTLLSREETKYSYDIEPRSGPKWIKKEKPSNSPIREVTKKELVPGVYGNLTIYYNYSFDTTKENLRIEVTTSKHTSQELSDMAKTLIEVADYLEGE